jgi:hypothetical protein
VVKMTLMWYIEVGFGYHQLSSFAPTETLASSPPWAQILCLGLHNQYTALQMVQSSTETYLMTSMTHSSAWWALGRRDRPSTDRSGDTPLE